MTGDALPQPIDLWLSRELRARNDPALRERVPEEWLRLIGGQAAVAGAETPDPGRAG